MINVRVRHECGKVAYDSVRIGDVLSLASTGGPWYIKLSDGKCAALSTGAIIEPPGTTGVWVAKVAILEVRL